MLCSFLRLHQCAASLALLLISHVNLWGALPGGSLSPTAVPKYVTPLLIPPVMPKADVISQRESKKSKQIDYYEISLRQFEQQVLPPIFAPTTVWGYGAVTAKNNRGVLFHHAPSLTIEAKQNRPVRVKWINELKDSSGNYLPHLFAVDQTLHWANPPGGVSNRDSTPQFSSTPEPYTGPVPMVVHLHGADDVGDDSDGYPEAWYLADAKNIPPNFASVGTWFDFFSKKARRSYGVKWGPGFSIFQYPNTDRASANWYHDHTLGMTRVNVYAGPAGFYIIRGGPDGTLYDIRTCCPAKLPGPAPKEGDPFPSDVRYFEIPLVIQDRSFNSDGSLFYPSSRAFFDGITGPYIPETDIPPQWNPEFFGNMIIVNGNTWPFQTVEQRRYRFRLLNGCNSRFLILDFNRIPGVEVWQLGNDGGFLATQLNLTSINDNRLLIAPAERADIIVDFSHVPLGSFVLANVGPDEPFGGGVPGIDFPVADPASTGQIMEFKVVPASSADCSTPPQYLAMPAIKHLPPEKNIRRVALLEQLSEFFDDAPAMALLGNVDGNPNVESGVYFAQLWNDPVSENPSVGVTEVWEIYNTTEDAHPIHLHETVFEVINRQEITIEESSHELIVTPGTVPIPPSPSESGFKDTVIAYPGQVLRIKVRFDNPGRYVWHCHILEHEDNEMMRPLQVGPDQPGQPSR